MNRYETAGVAASTVLRVLADEIEQGTVRVMGGELQVSDAGMSTVVECPERTGGELSTIVIRLVEGPPRERKLATGHASELEHELAHPGD